MEPARFVRLTRALLWRPAPPWSVAVLRAAAPRGGAARAARESSDAN